MRNAWARLRAWVRASVTDRPVVLLDEARGKGAGGDTSLPSGRGGTGRSRRTSPSPAPADIVPSATAGGGLVQLVE